MALFRLQKGASLLRIEKLKNRSATGIAGRCDWAERHKRRLPLFLQSLRNGAGHPRTEARSQGLPPHNEKAGSITGPASFIYLCGAALPPRLRLFLRPWAAFTGRVVSQGYPTRTADTRATIASTAFSHSHGHRGADRILRKILIFHLDLLAIECLMEHFVSLRDP